MADPKYVVRAIQFHCGDESGIDWTGSDEPVWIFAGQPLYVAPLPHGPLVPCGKLQPNVVV